MAIAVAAGAAVVVGVLAVVLVLWTRGDEEPAPAAGKTPAIEARGVFSPSNALFGDTVTATVEVTVDDSRIDPGSVRVRTDFSPWRAVVPPQSMRRDAGGTTYLRTAYVLRCLDRSCAPTSENDVVQEFLPARVIYTTRGTEAASNDSGVLEMQWPVLAVSPRYATSAGQGPASSSRWRMDILSLPAVSYGLRPGLLLVLVLGAAIVFALLGWMLARMAFPRTTPDVEDQGPPEPVLTPLERALVLLEDPTRVNGAGDQRRALEFVALELVARGDLGLAEAARALAWSEPVPETELTSGLAARARSAFGEEMHEDLR